MTSGLFLVANQECYETASAEGCRALCYFASRNGHVRGGSLRMSTLEHKKLWFDDLIYQPTPDLHPTVKLKWKRALNEWIMSTLSPPLEIKYLSILNRASTDPTTARLRLETVVRDLQDWYIYNEALLQDVVHKYATYLLSPHNSPFCLPFSVIVL